MHLDVRSCFSLKEGALTPEQLARRAAELGMPAVAMTDRDGLYGAARFVARVHREGVQPILGASLTVRTGGMVVAEAAGPTAVGMGVAARTASPRSPPHDAATAPHTPVVLLATDATGYANLCRLITDAHMLGERGDPSARLATQICAHAVGAGRAVVGPRSHAGRLAAAGRVDAAAGLLGPFREAFGARLFVGVEHRLEARSGDEVRAMLRLAERVDAGRSGNEPCPLPGARGRVPGRRPGVHAPDRPGGREQRHARATPRAG